jgi:hypothetical protein
MSNHDQRPQPVEWSETRQANWFLKNGSQLDLAGNHRIAKVELRKGARFGLFAQERAPGRFGADLKTENYWR